MINSVLPKGEIVSQKMMRYVCFPLIMLLIGCTPEPLPANEESPMITSDPTEPPELTIRFLALGDSYTIGQGVSEMERWPEQLSVKLREQGINVQVSINARTGWTNDNLLSSLSANPPKAPTYDLVSLLIGVNDQFRGGNPDDYRIGFRELLELAIVLAGGDPKRVIVVSIPDWEVTPFAKNLGSSRLFNIDDFNEVNFQESQTYGVRYVDITPISREAESDLSLLASDNLHPSGAMYALWVEAMLPQIIEMIR